jgi:hypothetical protein
MRLGFHFVVVISILTVIACGGAECARTVTGMLQSVSADFGSFVLITDDSTSNFVIAKDAKVMRGQVGKDLRAVGLRDLSQGDHIVAVVNQDGTAVSVKSFFGVVIGTAAGVKGDKLSLADGRSVTLRPEAQVVLSDGSVGKPSDIKQGMLVKCRVNPTSSRAWTVFAALPDKKAPAVKTTAAKAQKRPALVEPVSKPKAAAPEKPKILSVTYSAPTPLKAGDLLTVDVSGTPGGVATFEVKNLVRATRMAEVSPGAYRAVFEIPGGKTVHGASLVARMVVGGVSCAPVQASRLVNVESIAASRPAVSVQLVSMKPERVAVVTAKPSPVVVVPQVVVPIVQPTTPAPKETTAAKVILTNPPDGAKITRALLVRGTADPDSKVLVKVTYTNGLSGLLKLAGEVVSQSVAVGKNGEFRVGPIALEGPLATEGLKFTIKAYYPDREDHGTAIVRAIGARN